MLLMQAGDLPSPLALPRAASGDSLAARDATLAPNEQSGDVFVQRLTAAQSALYAFICALLGGTREAQDVLQETNAVLWRKAADYDPARSFLSWAYTFARFQVMAHRKRVARDHLLFDEALLDSIAETASRRNVDLDVRLRALDECVTKLPPAQRELVRRRYADGTPVNVLASQSGQTATAVGVLLHRIRLVLADCVRRVAAGVM